LPASVAQRAATRSADRAARGVIGIRRERGIAIITAMLVVALGTITVAAIASRQHIDMQRERNESLIQQAREFGYSGERFAAALLYRDVQLGLRNNTDSLDDDWAQTLPPVPIDQATITGCIVDMQGKFNLNNMINSQGQVVPDYVDMFVRLLNGLGIAPQKAQAVVDWLDENVDPTIPEGAEDDHYTSLTPAYRAANGPFSIVSELQLVKGFSALVEEELADYETLLPHIAALPTTGGPTALNVNTATPEVLSAMSDFLSTLGSSLSRWDTGAYEDYPECENIFDLTRDDGPDGLAQEDVLLPYESKLLFANEADPANSGSQLGPTPGADSYDVQSQYYQVRIDIAAEGLVLTQYTLMHREESGRTRVIFRARDTL